VRCPVTKNHKNRNKKTVCLQSFSSYSVCVCVFFKREMCSCADAGTFMTWEHSAHRQIWHISFLFRHSFLILVAHDDASIKKWKAIIPFYKIKKKGERGKKKSIYRMIIGNERAFLCPSSPSTRQVGSLPFYKQKSTRDFGSLFTSLCPL
jgi:hypothetical protein